MKFIDIRKRIKQAICSDPQELIMLVYTTPQEGIYSYEEVQPLVRCKNCLLSDTRWSPMHGIVVRYCRRFAEVYGEAYRVEDNGFCAWGERKVVQVRGQLNAHAGQKWGE